MTDLIDDATADLYLTEIDKVTGDDRLKMANALEKYADSLAEKRRQQTDEHFSKLFTDEAYFEQEKQANAAVQESLDPDQTAKSAAIGAWLEHHNGRPIDPMSYQVERDAFAMANYGKKNLDDNQLFDFISGEYNTQKKKTEAINDLQMQVAAKALSDAHLDSNRPFFDGITNEFNQWKAKYPELVDGKNDAAFLSQGYKLYYDVFNDIESVRGKASKALSTLTAYTQGNATDEDMQSLANDFVGAPPEDRQKIYKYVTLAAQAGQIDRAGIEQFAVNMGQAFTRGFDFVPQGTLQMQEAGVNNWLESIRNGTQIWVPADGDLTKAVVGNAPAGAESDAWRQATVPEAETLIQSGQNVRESFKVVRELRNVAKTGVDPIRPVLEENSFWGTAERGAYGLAGSIPLMGATAVNPFLGVLAYQSTEYDRIMLENPDVDPQFAQGLALVEGAANAAIDRVQLSSISGRLPMFGRYLDRIASDGVRRTVKIGANVVEQNLQEGAQDLIAPVLETAVAALREDMPDKDFGKLLNEWGGQRAETFFATLPLALIGGGVATYQDIKNPSAELNATKLRMAGFGQDQVTFIQRAENPEEYDARIKMEWEKRTPENIKAGEQEVLNTIEKARTPGELDARIERVTAPDGSEDIVVTSPDGRELLRTKSEQAALEAVRQHNEAQLINERNAVSDMVDYFRAQDPTNVATIEAPRTVQQELDRLTEAGDSKGIANLNERIRFAGIPEGSDLTTYNILGEANVETTAEGVFRGVIKLRENSRPEDAFEEINHVFVRKALAEGRTDLDSLRGWLNQTSEATGQTYATETETDIIENIAKVGMDYAAGRIDETSLPASFVDYIKRMLQVFKETMARAIKLKDAFATGKIDSNFESFLADSVGLNQQTRVDTASNRVSKDIITDGGQMLMDFSIGSRTNAVSTDTNYSIGKKQDADYLAAVERGDMQTAQKMADEAAKAAGYSGSDHRMQHSAPDRESTALASVKTSGLLPNDYWEKPQFYQSMPEEWESFSEVRDALNRSEKYTSEGKDGAKLAKITVYRSVPKSVKEESIRNGDWVTPSKEYAAMEGRSIPEGYKIISQKVSLKNLWWDGNSIAELGFDDGKDYAYKNTKNNRKLIDPVTYDENGNVIPLSQRFNPRSADINYSIGKAADLASKNPELAKEIQKKSDALLNAAEQGNDVFFTKFWPQMLKKTGMNFKPTKANLLKAAETGMPEILEWLKSNPQYLDYYHKDWELTHDILKAVFPKMADDDLTGFRLFTGITSPNTKLMHNMADAVQLFNLWMDKGSIKSMRWEWSAKGNRKVGGGPFTFSGTTGAGKTFTAHVLEDLHGKLGSWESVKNYLWEGVSIKELNAFNKEAGYKGTVDAGKIRQVVQSATGQSELIPRMFIFGPKVGAYTLNTSGDDRYTTTDIWEGRFIRSHFPAMFNDADGLPTSVEENKIFQEFAQAFNEVFKRESGLDLPPSALQAVRWFYMLNHAKKAGYKYASTDDTISGYTERAVRLKLGINPRPAGAGGTGSDQANNGAPVQKGDTNYSIASQSEIDRVNRALGGMNRGPDERLKVYQRGKEKFLRVMQQNKEELDAIRSAVSTNTAPAVEQVESERAAKLADLTAEESTEVAKALQDNADTFMPRIEATATPAERKRVERDAKDRAKILEKGIRDKYAERKAAIDTEAKTQRDQILQAATAKDSAANARMRDKVRQTKLVDAIGELDGILKALPPEVRGRVGGFAVLANIGTGDKALADFFVKRIDMIDRQLERTLKEEYGNVFDALLERTKPKKAAAGEKPKGIGADIQSLFAVVREARDWSAEKVDGHIANIETQIASGNLTAEEEAMLTREADLVSLAGDWKNADSSRRAAALSAATETWAKGMSAFVQKKIREREDRDMARAEAISATGKKGDYVGRRKRSAADNGLRGKVHGWFMDTLAWDGVVNMLFGHESPMAIRLSDGQRKAEYAKIDAVAAKEESIHDLFTKLANGNRAAGEKLMWQMSQPSISANGLNLSELEALSATMLWMQEDGRRHMEGELNENGMPIGKWHYDQKFIDEIEAALSPEAKTVRDYLLDSYGKEWFSINSVYREMNGINLSRIQNYSPVTVVPINAPSGMVTDPVTGNSVSATSISPGALRTRGTAIAEPAFRNVVQTYLAHTRQMEHWKAFAPWIKEANGILRFRDVQNSIKEAGGEEATGVLNRYLDAFSQGGNRDASLGLEISQVLNRMASRAAQVALIGRVGTLAIQTTQIGAASAELPMGAYVYRLGKLLTGNLGWGDSLNSAYIQRRLKQMPPIVQIAMEGLKAGKPNQLKHQVEKIGRLISGSDALWTAGTYAMVYDYNLSQAKTLGYTGKAAEDYAHNTAERITDRLAQPTRMGAKSIYEVTATNPGSRLGWAFASEARKNLALLAYTKANRPLKRFGATALGFIVFNLAMGAFIRNAWKDIRDDGDDEDEFFDAKTWNWKRIGVAMATEPLQGIPYLGDYIEKGINAALGQYHQSSDLISFERGVRAIRNIPDIVQGEREMADVLKDIDGMVSLMGLFNQNAAAAASLTHIASDFFGVVENATED